ncbi:Gfo/Idh/MocA family protein [Pseudarthrobacter sulfonivorans]|uniref:Gfo/Idh/MocA family protein n=1 Tax=Pseudarthrobacter sulfonivorans TaxID=121292 RepID=UPI0021061A61|nr:Gfo/Idh/MocA family oxidoreductase [Pseudarthrobacter sulfonivorans]
MVRLREVIREGAIGEVRKVIASHNQNLPKDPAHRLNDPALGGGAPLDLGVYPVSFALDILGTPETIRASASMTATGVDRQTAAVFEYADGQQAIIDCELDAAGPNRAVVIGTEGWIELDATWYNPTRVRRGHGGHGRDPPPDRPQLRRRCPAALGFLP